MPFFCEKPRHYFLEQRHPSTVMAYTRVPTTRIEQSSWCKGRQNTTQAAINQVKVDTITEGRREILASTRKRGAGARAGARARRCETENPLKSLFFLSQNLKTSRMNFDGGELPILFSGGHTNSFQPPRKATKTTTQQKARQ